MNEELRVVAWDFWHADIRHNGFEPVPSDPRRHIRTGQLKEKLLQIGLSKVTEADENQAVELFGWYKDRIMAHLSPFAREVQAWMNTECVIEYNRRRKLVLAKLDEMKLRSISDADEAQQQIIRDWIAGNP
jgi:hypothetical protein